MRYEVTMNGYTARSLEQFATAPSLDKVIYNDDLAWRCRRAS